MSEAWANLADWKLAWERVKADEVTGRAFARRPFQIELVEQELESWLGNLADKVRSRRYVPGPMSICDVPKRAGSDRLAGLLTPADRVVYAACVGACFRQIRRELSWPGAPVDFAQQLSEDIDDAEWVRRTLTWHDFQDHTLSKIGRAHV